MTVNPMGSAAASRLQCSIAFQPPIALRHHAQICLPGACRRHRFTSLPKCIVVLGGSSGVGLEAATYLKAKGITVTSFSRRTGHDLTNPNVSASVLHLARHGLAVSVGAGRRKSSREDELQLYSCIVAALADASEVDFVVAVARNLILADVRRMFADVAVPWVLLRPGPLVDEDVRKPHVVRDEKLLVTDDMRCNGLVSRRGVGAVVGDLLMGKVPIPLISHTVLGVYDHNRMINIPDDINTYGDHVWGS